MKAPNPAAAPLVAEIINAPMHICRTPKAKANALFHQETFFYFTQNSGINGRSTEYYSNAFFFSDYFPSASSSKDKIGLKLIDRY